MKRKALHDGLHDGLEPLESLNLDAVDSFSDLLRGMSRTAFAGRQLGRAFEVGLAMARDRRCRVVLTVSGAMTVAKQGSLICDMVEEGLVDAIVATGALIAHGLSESIGMVHFRYDSNLSDDQLFEQGYNRIYDTLEMESNLNEVETLVRGVMDQQEPASGSWSSAQLCRALGRRLEEIGTDRGILRSAFQHDVPVFIPAITDSELGLDMAVWAMRRRLRSSEIEQTDKGADTLFQEVPPFNPFLDIQQYARLVSTSEVLGIFTVGGGVPRNWAQQVAPYFDIVSDRLGVALPEKRFQYGIRICPEPVHWGGLSGCTYSEGVSWGKFVPPEEGGQFAEVHADATLVWPLLLKAILEELAS